MRDLNHILLKKGIDGLLYEDELQFKENIVKTISFKLNESIKETKTAVSQNLFAKDEITNLSENIKFFVEFVENFKPGKYTFKNGLNINISELDVKNVKTLFESLSPSNREAMTEEIFKSPENFKEHIKFAEKTKGLH